VRFLLDSGVWLWSIASPERINSRAYEVLRDDNNEVYFSAVTSWELSIKAGNRRLKLPAPPEECIPAFMAKQGLIPLAISHLHTVKVFDLPAYHRDPFDRLLIVQAMVEGMTILTNDREFERYAVDVVWCGK
jgi:PIN domain nuclease of toxin-antitoxin system